MNKIATVSANDRASLFIETAFKMGVRAALIEKDFWVSWTLRQLFTIPVLDSRILFKGGTSLSKIYRAIARFSEDIDLAVNYEQLGFTGDRHPSRTSSGKQRRELHEQMARECHRYVNDELMDHLRTRFTRVLGRSGNWGLEARQHPSDNKIPQILFTYPQSLSTGESLSYVEPVVLLELVIFSPFVPRSKHRIMPLAAEHFPHVFDQPECEVEVINAERTFWDKATILHAEYHRSPDLKMPIRYSRHYSDLAVMARTEIKNKALATLDLLAQVVQHKMEFYHNRAASYETAVPKTLRLVPPDFRMAELSRDYESMRVMFYANPYSFDKVMDELRTLEQEIRRL